MPTIQDDDLSTIPFVYEMAAASVRVPSINMAQALESGETFTTATSTLRNVDTDELVTIPAPTVNSTSIVQLLDGPTLGFTRGTTYDLLVVAVVSATSKPARHLRIKIVA